MKKVLLITTWLMVSTGLYAGNYTFSVDSNQVAYMNGKAVPVIAKQFTDALTSDSLTSKRIARLNALKSEQNNTIVLSAFDPLHDPARGHRLARLIEATDSRGMITAINVPEIATPLLLSHLTAWLLRHEYRNVFLVLPDDPENLQVGPEIVLYDPAAHVQVVPASLAAPLYNLVPQIGQWDRVTIHVPNDMPYTDPYRDVVLNVTLTAPDSSVIDWFGYYDGPANWLFRFMPDQVGEWSYRASFSDGAGESSGRFKCVESGLPGMITANPDNPFWFGYTGDGKLQIRSMQVGDRFFADSANSLTGDAWSPRQREEFLDWAQQQGYNTLSIASFLLNRDEEDRGRGWNTPDLWDSEAQRPNPAEYARMEHLLTELANRGIIVFPFAGFFGKSSDFPTQPGDQTVYLRYTLARLAPYNNLIFNVAGPEPLLSKGKKEYRNAMSFDDIDRLGQQISDLDVFGHLLTVHNETKASDKGDPFTALPWYTCTTMQGPKTKNREKLYKQTLANHGPERPYYAQETLWSGNKYHPNYKDRDLRKNAIVLTMAGAAVNFADNDGNSSSGFSGSMDLSQCNQDKHDILKSIWNFFDTMPLQSMVPRNDIISNGYCLADSGQAYLVYIEQTDSLYIQLADGSYFMEWVNAKLTFDRRPVVLNINKPIFVSPKDKEDWFLYFLRRK